MKNRLLVTLTFFAGLSLQADAVTLLDLMDRPQAKEYVYKTCGTNELKMFVFQPVVNEPGVKKPMMVWIHGGAWVAGSADAFFPHARYCASRGAVGVSVDYRLVKAGGSLITDCIADCKSAIRYIRKHADELGVDANRIAVLGDSAGGHLAACLGMIDGFDDPADDVSVGAKANLMVLYNAVMDLNSEGFHKFVLGGAALDKKAAPEQLKPTPESLALSAKISPLANVRPGLPPALVMHGLDDKTVPAKQSATFSELMQKAGNACLYIPLEGRRHAFIVTKYSATEQIVVDALRTTDEFLSKAGYLSGPPTLEISPSPAWTVKGKK